MFADGGVDFFDGHGVDSLRAKLVLDRHIPMAAFVLVMMLWLVATVMKVNLCVQLGPEGCR